MLDPASGHYPPAGRVAAQTRPGLVCPVPLESHQGRSRDSGLGPLAPRADCGGRLESAVGRYTSCILIPIAAQHRSIVTLLRTNDHKGLRKTSMLPHTAMQYSTPAAVCPPRVLSSSSGRPFDSIADVVFWCQDSGVILVAQSPRPIRHTRSVVHTLILSSTTPVSLRTSYHGTSALRTVIYVPYTPERIHRRRVAVSIGPPGSMA